MNGFSDCSVEFFDFGVRVSFDEKGKYCIDIDDKSKSDSDVGKITRIVADNAVDAGKAFGAWVDDYYEIIKDIKANEGKDEMEGDLSIAKTEDDFIQYKRNGYGFRYFFNAGLDKRTGICDGEGVDCYIIDEAGNYHFTQEVYDVTLEDIENMTDKEFDEFLVEYEVF